MSITPVSTGFSTYLFWDDDFAFGRFDLPADGPRWDEPNTIGGAHHVVFPGSSVEITRGGRRLVTDLNTVVYYNSDDEYRRRALVAEGDRCHFLIASPRLLLEVTQRGDTDGGFRFGEQFARLSSAAYVRRSLAARVLEGEYDPIGLSELLLETLRLALQSTTFQGQPVRSRPRTLAERRELIEGAKAVMALRFQERLTLRELATAVHASQYHLARVFRQGTGSSLHVYLTNLRVRAAIDQLARGRLLSDLALAVGFNSHAHLTDTFRRFYGVPPSTLSKMLDRRSLEQARTILEVALPPSS